MTTYLLLVWQSIFAPRAAVDLARQHPKPLTLGLIYLGAICLLAFALEFVRPLMVQPLQPPEPGASNELSVLDEPLASGLFNVFFYVFSFGFALWFWRRFAPSSVKTESVQTVVAVGIASSLGLLLPTDFLLELTENSTGWLLAAIVALFLAITLLLSTIYASYGLELSLTKSFWLNVLAMAVTIIFMFAASIGVMAFSGELNFDQEELQ